MLISPIILYAAEAWTLSKAICQHQRASERKILRRIYGVIYSNSHWRIRYNYELQTLYEDMDTVTLIRVRIPNWIGHINWTDDTRKV
jgi:hypothetical protein